jgi:hypothetical protein
MLAASAIAPCEGVNAGDRRSVALANGYSPSPTMSCHRPHMGVEVNEMQPNRQRESLDIGTIGERTLQQSVWSGDHPWMPRRGVRPACGDAECVQTGPRILDGAPLADKWLTKIPDLISPAGQRLGFGATARDRLPPPLDTRALAGLGTKPPHGHRPSPVTTPVNLPAAGGSAAPSRARQQTATAAGCRDPPDVRPSIAVSPVLRARHALRCSPPPARPRFVRMITIRPPGAVC